MNRKLVKQRSEYKWLIEKTGRMNVDGIIYASEPLITEMDDKVVEQIRMSLACRELLPHRMRCPMPTRAMVFVSAGSGHLTRTKAVSSLPTVWGLILPAV